MTTQEVAQKLVELCRHGKNDEAIETLYADNVVSVEADGEPKEVKGLEGVKQKSAYFDTTFEVHGAKISAPLVTNSHFAITYMIDTTHKESGRRSQMTEICVYEVQDGKIVREEFFYPKRG